MHRPVYNNNVNESELRDISASKHLTRVNGTAVFMMGSPTGAPIALLHLEEGQFRVVGRYGHMEWPDATAVLLAAQRHGVPIESWL